MQLFVEYTEILLIFNFKHIKLQSRRRGSASHQPAENESKMRDTGVGGWGDRQLNACMTKSRGGQPPVVRLTGRWWRKGDRKTGSHKRSSYLGTYKANLSRIEMRGG